jgi:N-dimethylarginine dimethylaminohydrolase
MAPLYYSISEGPRAPRDCAATAPPARVVLCDPAEFDVVEAINVHMRDASGQLNRIDRAEARRQWQQLVDAYRGAGIDVSILPAAPGLHDFCFAANPSFVLPLPGGQSEVWLGRMAHASRRGEVAFHAEFAKRAGLVIREMPPWVESFEGTGDAVLHPGRFALHAGVGPRTSESAWRALAQAHPEMTFYCYRLQNPEYYHLDTALAPLDETRAMIVREAFDEDGRGLLQNAFSDLFEIPRDEALRFAGNAHCPDGRHVLLQRGCARTESWLASRGYVPVPVETSEFIKSGGSVFCLKQAW